MNDFQNIGDLLQLVAMMVLLLKIVCTADCTGISAKTQILYALVFTTRFIDLPLELRISLLHFVIKIIYLLIAYLTVASIVVIFRKSYNSEYDTFRFELLIGISSALALLASYNKWEFLDVLWYMSIYLETFAMFPQIQFTARSRYGGSSLLLYVGLFACFRAFYVVQWSYRLMALGKVGNYHVVIAGIAQFFVYSGYFAWMVPLFKAQYVNLEMTSTASTKCGSGGQIIMQPDVLTIVQANGTDESRKVEPFLGD